MNLEKVKVGGGLLGGCSGGSTIADHMPTALGGLPGGHAATAGDGRLPIRRSTTCRRSATARCSATRSRQSSKTTLARGRLRPCRPEACQACWRRPQPVIKGRPAVHGTAQVGRSWGHGRISPHPASAALRLRAGQSRQGGGAQCRRRHHRSRHGQSGPAGARARHREAQGDARQAAHRPLFGLAAASRACAAPRPPITRAASA